MFKAEVAKKLTTHFMFNNSPPPNIVSLRDNVETHCGAGQATGENMEIWRMRISRWVPKAANPHSQYVILIAFPPRRWLQ